MPLHGVCFTEDKMANGLTPGPYSRQEDIFQIFQEPYPVYTPDPNLSDEMNLFLANKQLEARDSGVSLAQRLPHGPLMNWIDSIQTGPTESQEGWSLTGSVPMERNIPVHENKKMAAFLDDPTLPSSDYDPSIPVPAGFPSQLETLIASRPEIQQGRSTSGDPLQALKQGNRMRPRGKLKTDIPRYQAPTIPIPRTEPSPQDNSVVSTPSQQRPQQRPQPPNPLAAYDAVMKREPGFFQENAPLILGLLGGVSGLLEASGPSRVPVSGGQVFARGLQSGLKGYMGGLDYQKGMRTSQQEEAKNVLDATTWREKFQNAELKRQQRVNLGNSIREGLRQLDMETLSPEMKRQAKLAQTLVNSGSIESAWQIFSKIAATPEAQASIQKMGDDTLLYLDPQKEGPPVATQIWNREVDPASTQDFFFTGQQILDKNPNLGGTIDPIKKYRAVRNKDGVITDYEEFNLTQAPKTTPELMEDIAKGEGAVAKRYRSEAKDYFSIADSFKKVEASALEESPAGDIALIFAYMKMLDPGSVVREGEFATAQNTGSVSERVYVLYNKLLKGDRLTTSQRQMFMKSANNVLGSQRDRVQNLMSFYTGLATDYGYKPERIVRDPFEGISDISVPDTSPDNSGVTSPFKHTVPNPRGGKLRFGAATIK